MVKPSVASLEKQLNSIMQDVDERLARLEPEMRRLAREKITLLESKLAKFDTILEERSCVLQELANFRDLFPDLNEEPQHNQTKPSTAPRPGEFANLSNWQAAEVILRRKGKPMSTGKIAKEVIAGGKTPKHNLSSTISGAMEQKVDVFSFVLRKNKRIWRLREGGASK